ncbi:alpha-L-arabinofuranosidase C-terminal domain-containing protein [uncultured Vagococcus sp.]|uniref:alpha-N-arabinofuranosidase n=1 Tax=uncultured Vagococcus sp. TaxID=189676 RepID=UPI0028D8169C|nr:alpha-L-arabinofuranosidase C-terminal domain-containing protein [uncultured Vagococcus sp.]
MKLTIVADKKGPKISKYIYGQFAEHLGRCIYEGIWVGKDSEIPNVNGIRSDVVAALKQIKVPVVRWPGGCFADEYHWQDGLGPKENRKKIVNTHWGGVTEDNAFGTHEFFELIEQLGCEAYVNGNVGSGTVLEMQEWVDYITNPGESPMASLRQANQRQAPWKMAFFGVGNESWGCGGNMRPEYYADLYRQYQTYVRQYGPEKTYKIACGPNIDDYHWMEVLMREATPFMDGISLHHYALTGPWEDKGPALNFPESQWNSLLESAKKMDELITKHSRIMDQYDPEKRVGLIVDEWGSWLSVEPGTNPGFLYQQNTIRDAMVAAVTLNIFHKHAYRVQMANIAQMVNVLQAMILTDGAEMLKTPTYHVFDLYQNHQEAELITSFGEENQSVSHTISKKEGRLTLTLCNTSVQQDISVELTKTGGYQELEGHYIAAREMDAHNSFAQPEAIKVMPFAGFEVLGDQLRISLPPMSVVTIAEVSDGL